jgi:3-deoxy-D-manno-octulosonic-acid transferase
VIFIYNFIMIALFGVLCPIWVPLVWFRKKHRRTFFKRLFMAAIPRNDTDAAGVHGPIWIHALSVGEVLSAEPLVKALSQKYGAGALVFSASTQSGFETATRVIALHVGELRHFPYDTFFSVKRALQVVRPRRVVIVETDIWPNFLYRLKKCRIPVHLVNARLSDRSFQGYKRIRFLMAPLLSIFSRICVQTDADRARFLDLGVSDKRLATVGNIKFDQAPVSVSSDDLNQLSEQLSLSGRAPVWVAGSTHEGEEALLSDAYGTMRSSGIDPVLIIAPRDPDRAAAVCDLFNRSGIDARTMDQIERQPGPSAVVVVDRIGILRNLYALADVTFVGGSLVAAGGHNPLEPASVAKPICFGPHTDDFRWICQTLVDAGGAFRVNDARELSFRTHHLFENQEANRRAGRRASEVFFKNRGAVARTLAVIGTS